MLSVPVPRTGEPVRGDGSRPPEVPQGEGDVLGRGADPGLRPAVPLPAGPRGPADAHRPLPTRRVRDVTGRRGAAQPREPQGTGPGPPDLVHIIYINVIYIIVIIIYVNQVNGDLLTSTRLMWTSPVPLLIPVVPEGRGDVRRGRRLQRRRVRRPRFLWSDGLRRRLVRNKHEQKECWRGKGRD